MSSHPTPDPNCRWCKGRGTVGGCEGRHTPDPTHQHTWSFCICLVPEEAEEVEVAE